MNFCSAKEVREHFNSIKNVNVSNPTLSLADEEIFSKRISELEALRSQMLANEQSFYSKVCNGIGDPIQALAEVQRKIDIWNSTAGPLINMNVNSLILKIGEGFAVDLEELKRAYATALDEDGPLHDMLVKDNIGELSEVAISTLVNYSKELKLDTSVSGFSSAFKGETFEKILARVEIEKGKKSKLMFNIDAIGNLGKGSQNRLAILYNTLQKDDDKKLKTSLESEELKQYIINTILETVSGPAKEYIAAELAVNYSKYGMTEKYFNYAVVKGFLGEVYWNACIRYLTNGRLTSFPTGTVKDMQGKSITIDMIFEGFGFQVKAYNMKDGQVTFGSHGASRQAGTFTIERAQLVDGIGEAILTFFATRSFNYPIENSSKDYRALYEQGRVGYDQVTRIFDAYADRIIGLDKTFEADIKNSAAFGGFFSNGYGLYYNTFFLINSKIVPGSSIITGIINGIKTPISDRNIQFTAEYTEPGDGEHWSPEKKNPTKNLLALANQIKMTYDVVLNVEEMINQAYSFL